MKPMNFPGRKNERRKRALARMAKPPADLSAAALSEHPWEITRARILPDAIARGVRTKKDRTHRAKIAR
jgi:hypothetical protein